MKQLLKWMGLLGFLCVALLLPTRADAASVSILEHPTVAVTSFDTNGVVSSEWRDENLSNYLGDLSDELSNAGKFHVVERKKIRDVLNEYNFQMTGITDASTNAQIGKLLGAQYIVIASVTSLTTRRSQTTVLGSGQKKYRVTATISLRFVDVETGEIVLAARGVGKDTNKLTRGPLNIFRIGTDEVDEGQVDSAMINAIDDAVYGERGLVARMEGRAGRKR